MPVQGLKLGLPKEYFEGLGRGNGRRHPSGCQAARKTGCEVQRDQPAAHEYALSCYYIIATAEASSNLARYDGVRYTIASREQHAVRHVSQYARRRLSARK